MSIECVEIPALAADGHAYQLTARIPPQPTASLLWLPALGVAAKHYVPFAEALAKRGVAVFLHEMRGNGSSSLRASRTLDWGYREILADIASSDVVVRAQGAATARIIGGHSIGAQFAACHLGMNPGAFQHLWLVASGSPYWRTFPAPKRYVFPFAYQFIAWLAERRGTLPGRQLGFGGDEARSLMREWVQVGLSNRYAADGLDTDLEAALSTVEADVQAVLLDRDWFAPRRSMQALLDKLPRSLPILAMLDSKALGIRADHFAWMKQPGAVVDVLLRERPQSPA
jgi:predicted alpha/beta hydrolase